MELVNYVIYLHTQLKPYQVSNMDNEEDNNNKAYYYSTSVKVKGQFT